MSALSVIRAVLAELFSRSAAYQGRALLTVVYYTAVAASAIMLRLRGGSAAPPAEASYWRSRPPRSTRIEDWFRQY